jgi:hypothetical protein
LALRLASAMPRSEFPQICSAHRINPSMAKFWLVLAVKDARIRRIHHNSSTFFCPACWGRDGGSERLWAARRRSGCGPPG